MPKMKMKGTWMDLMGQIIGMFEKLPLEDMKYLIDVKLPAIYQQHLTPEQTKVTSTDPQ